MTVVGHCVRGGVALKGLELTIQCPGLQVTYVTSAHNSYIESHGLTQPERDRSAILPCAWKAKSWKVLVKSTGDGHILLS